MWPTLRRTRARVCGGVDWAQDDHAVCVVGAEGEALQRFTVAHDAAGLEGPGPPAAQGRGRRGRDRTTRRAGRRRPARRRVDRAGHPARPGQEPARPVRVGRQQGRPVRRVRAGRHAAHRPAPAAPAGPRTPRPTTALRPTCRARKDLVAHRVAVANQLRAHLQIVFPGAVGLFADIDSAISLRFLDRFDCPGPRRLAHREAPRGLAGLGRLLRPHRSRGAARPDDRRAPRRRRRRRRHPRRGHPRPMSRCCAPWSTRSRPWPTGSPNSSPCTPTRTIFTSLPRSGTVRAARLLAEIGDGRGRFPTPELAGLPGRRRPLDPPVRQDPQPSAFRWAADKQLRDAVCDFAGDSRHAQPLGRRPLPTSPRPRPRPPARRPHPRPRLATRHLALLAGQHRLRPRPTPRPPSASSTKINRRRLDTGQLIGRPHSFLVWSPHDGIDCSLDKSRS